MAKGSDDKHEFDVLMVVALYWANYYKHCDMPVEKECFGTLAELGVIAKITENIDEFMKFGETFDAGLHCTGKAGTGSKAIANKLHSDVVTPAICERAFKRVAGAIEKVNTKKGRPETQGPLC